MTVYDGGADDAIIAESIRQGKRDDVMIVSIHAAADVVGRAANGCPRDLDSGLRIHGHSAATARL